MMVLRSARRELEPRGGGVMSRRRFLGYSGRAAAGVAAAYALSGVPLLLATGCGRKPTEEELILGKSVDVTDLVESVQAGQPFVFAEALGERYTPEVQESWRKAREDYGWSDERVRELLIDIREGRTLIRRATSGVFGREFDFAEVRFIFDEEQTSVSTIPDPQPALLVNLMKPFDKVAPYMKEYSSLHEINHNVATEAARIAEREGRERWPYLNFEELRGSSVNVRYIHSSDIDTVVIEAVCDKLAFRMSEFLGIPEAFRGGFRDYARIERARYEARYSSGDRLSLSELADMASISASSRYFGDAETSAGVDEFAGRWVDRMAAMANRGNDAPSIRDEYSRLRDSLLEVSMIIEPRRE